MAHEIAAVIQCKLCNAKLAGPTIILGPELPMRGRARIGQFLQSISQHLIDKHPSEYEYLQQKAMEFVGLQTLMQYTTSDEGIRYSRDWLRWQIHQCTLNATCPDEKIAEQSKKFAEKVMLIATAASPSGYQARADSIAAEVSAIMTGLRDLLQEPHEPRMPASVQVLTRA